MIQFPYGIADFRRIRRERMVYVDRTAHIRDLETLGSILVFLRPRRFGKSLWLQTLATYYDLRYANAFDILFELKLVRRKTLGKKAQELRNMDEAALRQLPAVKAALAAARGQAEDYLASLVRQRGDTVRPRGYAVVAVGLERLLGEEVRVGL